MTTNELNIFKDSLGISESSGDYNNDLGQYWGKYQFGDARRYDIEKMLGINHHLTRDEFTPEVQEQFFSAHVQDYENRIHQDGLEIYFDTTITGISNGITVKINKYGLIAGAHLGGYSGMKKYFTTGGTYDPADNLGTHISDYIAKFSSISKKKISLKKSART
jgi:hypothetical protein